MSMLRSVAGRFQNRELSRGFLGWCDYLAERRKQIERLTRIAGKMKAPRLATAFAMWRVAVQGADLPSAKPSCALL